MEGFIVEPMLAAKFSLHSREKLTSSHQNAHTSHILHKTGPQKKLDHKTGPTTKLDQPYPLRAETKRKKEFNLEA